MIPVEDWIETLCAEQFVLPTLPPEMYAVDLYDHYHINFSGGADSLALALLMKYGYKIPSEKMVLVHMRVDGNPEEKQQLFDWPQTDEYLRYASEKLDIPLVVIWGDKSLEERIRDRKMFPDKSCRFCTSYTKRDVYAKWVRQFDDCKILMLTGERSEESSDRAKEPIFEYHPAQATKRKNREVHWFRPIKNMLKSQVKQLAANYSIELHPCYQWVSRCSCRFCIFNTASEMERVAQLYPDDWEYLKRMELHLGHTMKTKRGKPVLLSEFVNESQVTISDFI
ncbi:phosphoadenosine phosphosulfate reductase family protein [Paenibacillus sp. PDC88]|uniref:phosphoadenosine phosphosulfate reductase domain-containing protein n=1 Tax=Paenibacillus sp. PDC88 TaxID=1884375 RepID=UPI00210BA604|nr:phosphoadenosine phosphosulfate reductase family protein [Paenibacillus sp. PDC88]